MNGATVRVRGTVINVHALGATVRLESGRLVAAPLSDVNAHRAVYARAVQSRAVVLPFDLRGRIVTLAAARSQPDAAAADVTAAVEPPPPGAIAMDERFEARMDAYLKSTQEWAPPDRPQPFERHLFRKSQRAKFFRGGMNAPGE